MPIDPVEDELDQPEDEASRKKDRKLLLALLLLLLVASARRLKRLSTGYFNKPSLTAPTASEVGAGFSIPAYELLLSAHTHAVMLGRQLAGDFSPLSSVDEEKAKAIMQGQAEYLAKFTRDIERGRYSNEDGTYKVDMIARRIARYARRIRGTANQSWKETLPAGTIIKWVLGPNEDHCSDCPDLAEGEWTVETLPTVPGAGGTDCNIYCYCELETEDGQRGFPPPPIKEKTKDNG